MSNRFDFPTIRAASELFGRDFQEKLSELELFEENVMAYRMALQDADFRYIDNAEKKYEPFVIILPTGQELVLAHKAVADILSKSKIKTSISSYDDVSRYKDKFNALEKVGTSILYEAISDTHRDAQKVIEYDGVARAVLNHTYPSEVFRLNRLASAIVDQLEINGDADIQKADLRFDVDSGNVRLQVVASTDKLNDPNIQKNDEVGFGVTILNNYYGNRRFSLYLSTLNLACLNGMLSSTGLCNLDIIHSSTRNFAQKLGSWLMQNASFGTITDQERYLLRWFDTGRWIEEAEEPMFYEFLAKTIVETVQREKEKTIVQMKAAASRTFADFSDEMEKLEKTKKITRAQSLGIEHVWDSDDLIASGQLNDYQLAQAVSRFANEPSNSDKTREELQVLAHEILVRG